MVEAVSAMQSIIAYSADNHFPLENIPFGVFKNGDKLHVCTRIGDQIVDLAVLKAHGLFDGQHLS